MHKILISACLLGENVRYDGNNSRFDSASLQVWMQQGRLLSLCPEVAGGLPVPRPAAEIDAGDAEAVIKGAARIRRQDGSDVSAAFMAGAEKALALCIQHDIRLAILKEGSPSCGVNRVNDGSFSGTKISGQGVTARLLVRHGIAVFSEFEIAEVAAQLLLWETDYVGDRACGRQMMANRSLGLSGALYDYLLDSGLREPDVLQRLRQATEKQEMSIMRSAPEQGQLMAMLIRLMAAKRVIEVGTYTGYATLWMAQALPRDGEIISCDVSETWTRVAQQFWHEAGVQDKISLHLRPAIETLDALIAQGQANSFDFIFIDADKENYAAYYESCLSLLRSGGLMLIDNVLWGGSVIDNNNHDASTTAIRAFNRALKNDSRIDINMLPVADGITLAVKK